MPLGSSTPTRSPARKPVARRALPTRSVALSRSVKVIIRSPWTSAGAGPNRCAARRTISPISTADRPRRSDVLPAVPPDLLVRRSAAATYVPPAGGATHTRADRSGRSIADTSDQCQGLHRVMPAVTSDVSRPGRSSAAEADGDVSVTGGDGPGGGRGHEVLDPPDVGRHGPGHEIATHRPGGVHGVDILARDQVAQQELLVGEVRAVPAPDLGQCRLGRLPVLQFPAPGIGKGAVEHLAVDRTRVRAVVAGQVDEV